MKNSLLLLLALAGMAGAWRQYPQGKLCEVTYEHQMIPERDTLLVKHWHKVENKIYVLPLSGGELWVDNIKEIAE